MCYRGPRTGVVFFFIGPVLPLAPKGETWRAGSYCLGLNWCAFAKLSLFLGICHVILTKGEGVLKNTLAWKRQNNTLRPKKDVIRNVITGMIGMFCLNGVHSFLGKQNWFI